MKTTLRIGDVLWRMHGTRDENGRERWFPCPISVEYLDEHKFLDGRSCGGSLNSIGINYFLTRQECLEHFEAHRAAYQALSENTAQRSHEKRLGQKIPDGRYFWRFDGVLLKVYVDNVLIEDSRLPWKTDDRPEQGSFGDPYTTLGAIRSAFGTGVIITVWAQEELKGEIYETGNYSGETDWRLIGKTMGYW